MLPCFLMVLVMMTRVLTLVLLIALALHPVSRLGALAQDADPEPETFTFDGPWTFALDSPDAAEAWLRDHPAPYADWPARSEAADRGISVASWKIISVEFKASDNGANYRSRARAVIEVTVAAESEEEDDLADGDVAEAPRDPEDLDVLEDWVTSEVTEAAVLDMLAEIYDVENKIDTMITVLTRLSGSAATKGLWSGVKSANRYISRLQAMSDRVADVKAKVTSLQDGQWEQVEDALRDLGNDLDDMHFDSGTSERISYEDPFMVVYAEYEEARSDLLSSVFGAQQHAKYGFEGDVQIAKVQARLEQANHDDTKDAVQSAADAPATRDRLKARLAAASPSEGEAEPQTGDSIDAEGGVLRLDQPSVMAAADSRAPLGQARQAREREAAASLRAQQRRQAELARQRNASPSQAEQTLHLTNLERDYLNAELERVALSPDSVIYAAVFLYNGEIDVYGNEPDALSNLSFYDIHGHNYPYGWYDSLSPKKFEKADVFARACLERQRAFVFDYREGNCIYPDSERFRTEVYDRQEGKTNTPFVLLSHIVAVPFDSSEPFASLVVDQAWQGFWHKGYDNFTWEENSIWSGDWRFCQFPSLQMDENILDQSESKLGVPLLADGSVWTSCARYGSPAYNASTVLHVAIGDSRSLSFKQEIRVFVSRNKQDLLELASVMGPILNDDYNWPEWPQNPRALDLSLQQELEARLQAISD